jgi:EAL domain-containing protein (putative c-di-GMP-specific phosphodiesterase class I)
MTLLDEILAPKAVTTVFQPILRIAADGTRALHGYEALTRGPRETHASRADVLFEYVRRKRAEAEVDRVCVLNALRAARALPSCPHLSLNVHAATLARDPEFGALLIEAAEAHGFHPTQLVVEIVEQSSQWNTRLFARGLDVLRSYGVGIALDDVGFGHSNLHMVLEVRPHFLKIDRYFVTHSAADRPKQAVLRAVQSLATDLGCRVVAEGVETAEDLRSVQEAGIALAQGYLLSPPLAPSQFSIDITARPQAVSLSA